MGRARTANVGTRGARAAPRWNGVVGVGLCAVDHLYVVEELDRLGASDVSRVRYVRRLVSAGGMVGTALAQAAQLGCPSELVSVVGDDADGSFALAALRRLGVRTRRTLRSARCPTSIAVVLVRARDGERRFVVPDRRTVERRAPALDLSPVGERTVLLVDGHYPAQAMRAAKRARRAGGVVVGDFSDARPAYHRLLPYVDFPIVPAEFGASWGCADARATLAALRDAYGGRPVVTQGRRGALALVDGRVRRIPAVRVRVVDTTGAGDAYHGAFAAGLVRGLEPVAALGLAARAAARVCTALGGQSRLLRR